MAAMAGGHRLSCCSILRAFELQRRTTGAPLALGVDAVHV